MSSVLICCGFPKIKMENLTKEIRMLGISCEDAVKALRSFALVSRSLQGFCSEYQIPKQRVPRSKKKRIRKKWLKNPKYVKIHIPTDGMVVEPCPDYWSTCSGKIFGDPL